ncbi:MAG: hypothetical protein LBF38_10795 [Deltaproteobacteria bacterium]|jgi:hypothetical protein|nr:hypothetical protein [Deltaproteobacteria bacterium]
MPPKGLTFITCSSFFIIIAMIICYIVGLIIGSNKLPLISSIILLITLITLTKVSSKSRHTFGINKFLDDLFDKYNFDLLNYALFTLQVNNDSIKRKFIYYLISKNDINFISSPDRIQFNLALNHYKVLDDAKEYFNTQSYNFISIQLDLFKLMIPYWKGYYFINLFLTPFDHSTKKSTAETLYYLTNDFNCPEKFDVIYQHTQPFSVVNSYVQKLIEFATPDTANALSQVYGQPTDEIKESFDQNFSKVKLNKIFDKMVDYYTDFSKEDYLLRWLFVVDSSRGLMGIEFIFLTMWIYAYQIPHDAKRFNQALDLYSRAYSLAIPDSAGRIKFLPPLDVLLARIKSFEKQGLELDDRLVAMIQRWANYYISQKNANALTYLASGLKWLNQPKHERELKNQMEKFNIPLTLVP